MKLAIASHSQEEFDEKRPEIIKAIAGSKYEVEVKKAGQVTADTPRKPFFKAQEQMLHYWDAKYKEMVGELKEQIGEIISES